MRKALKINFYVLSRSSKLLSFTTYRSSFFFLWKVKNLANSHPYLSLSILSKLNDRILSHHSVITAGLKNYIAFKPTAALAPGVLSAWRNL